MMKDNTIFSLKNALAFLLFMGMALPAMAYSESGVATRSGTSGGVNWNANFQIKFENNTGHSYSWWTGDGEGSMWNRLCSVEIGNGATCTTALPGFDIKLGVGVKHSKDMEYQETQMEFYLVNSDGSTRYVNYAYFNNDDSQNYKLDNRTPGDGYSYITHPQLFRTGSGKTSYEHKIGARVTLTKKVIDEGYTRLKVTGYSKYYKNPTWRAKVYMYVHFEYYINLSDIEFELAPDPEFVWTSPTEMTLKFSNNSLSRINNNQKVSTSESTRLGIRHCGIESSSVSTNYYMWVQSYVNGNWKNLYNKDINVDGYDPKEVKLEVPADKPFRFVIYHSTTSTLNMKTAYYRGGTWTTGNRTLKQVSERVNTNKEFTNAAMGIKADFNQVTGKVLLSWDKKKEFPSDSKFYVYRTLLNNDGTYAGNREELGSTTSNTFEDNADRGMLWGRKYRYEVVLILNSWTKDGFSIPTDPQPLTNCNFAQCTANTTPIINFHLTQDMGETEKIKLDWNFENIPEKESDLTFRIHRINTDGTMALDYGSVDARRKDGKTSFLDEKPESNCDVYRYYVQLDLFNNALHYYSDTITARITASTTITDLSVTKGSISEGVRVTWKVNQVGTDPTQYLVKRRFIGSSEWITVHSTKGTEREYTFLDSNTETGRYYEYCVEAYGSNCEDSDSPLLTDSRIEPGFGQGSGTISGRVTFGTGTAVENVKVNLQRSDDEENSQTYSFARKVLESGNGISWNTQADQVRELMGATKEWTVQMWVRPDNLNTTDRLYLLDIYRILSVYLEKSTASASNYRLSWLNCYDESNTYYTRLLSDNIPADEYSHITVVHKSDTVLAYVNGELKATQYISKNNYDQRLSTYTGDLGVMFGTGAFTGYLDEVRLWGKALTAKEVSNNYGRIIGGREEGLKLYWPFDEGLDEYAFDVSRTSGVANGRHPSVGASKSSQLTPSSSQLGLYGLTNTQGEYVIRGIPFTGSGTGYTVRPELGVHEFSPNTRTGFISNSSLSLNNYDFTDVSSFTVTGKVMYEGTDIPVDSVQFAVDGTVCMADGEIVYTNANGEYTISVPIGFHYITASRSGHTLVGQGRFPQEKGATYEFRTDQTINFTDNTLVHFGGRLTGSATEGKKPLGYGVSQNTIGQATLQLEALDFPQCRLNVVEETNGLVTQIVNNKEDVPIESNSNDVNSTSWRAGGDDNAVKNIYIKTDPKTGEFSAMLPPLRYRIRSVKFEHNPDLNEAYTFQNLNAIDLSKVYETAACDTLWDDSHTSYAPLFQCNKVLRLTYRSPVEFEVNQVGVEKGFFGTDSVNVKVTGQDDARVAVATLGNDGTPNYLYGYPIFEQSEQYTFKVRAFESYINYDEDKEGRRYEAALRDSIITIDNEMGESVKVARESVTNDTLSLNMGDIVNLETNQMKLDSLGTAMYKWKAGFPNLTAPHTRAMNIFTTVDGAVYGWRPGSFDGIVFGAIPTGNNFVTAGPDKLAMVLRDPPGANSSATWQKDSVHVESHDHISFDGTKDGISWNFGTGMKSSIYSGIGVMTEVLEAKAYYDNDIGTEGYYEDIGGGGSEITMSTTEKISTSTLNTYVGSDGDIFIGYSKNYLFGGAMIVGLQKQVDGTYKLGMDKGMSVSSEFNTFFRYTQKYLEETQLPNLRMLRNQLLTQVSDASQIPVSVDRVMFYTTLSPDDPKFGSSNTDKKIWGSQASDPANSQDGPSYSMRVPENFEGVDSIAFYNNTINNWIKCMRENEEDKVKAFSDIQLLEQNYSWDRGTTVSFTSSKNDKTWEYSGEHWGLAFFAKLKYGAEATATGAKTFTYQLTNFDIHTDNTDKDTETTSTTKAFSYTLNDDNRSAALSIDVYKSPKNWGPIFRTRGGQTRCPYEGEEKTKYYEPVTVLNYATMKIDNPKISIPENMILDVPSGRDATLEIVLKNESETGEELLVPILKCLDNPDGLQIFLEGEPIAGGLAIGLPYNVETRKVLTIRQSDTSILDYDNLELGLISDCLFNHVYDKAHFSIHFTQAAPQATILVNKTVVNAYDVDQNEKGYLTVTAKDYDRTFNGFKSIRFKYRFIGDNSWITAHEYFNGMDMVPDGKLQDGQSLLPTDKSSVSHSFALPLIDGHYMVCIETTSKYKGNEVTWQSEEIEIVKDTHGPMLLGQAYPNTGILTPTDDIHIKFNEPIRANYLTKEKNFTIVGDLNESPIDHYVSLQLNGTPLVYEGYIPVSNTSFSASMWLYRQSGGTILKHGTTNSQIALSVDDNGYATLTVDGQQFAANAVPIPAEQWVFLTSSYVHSSTENYYDAQISYGSETKVLFDHQPVPQYSNTAQLTLAENLKGAMHELSIWSTARTPEQMREYMWKSLPIYKDGLMGYWRMNEGHGTTVTDCARGRNMYLTSESWNLNNDNKAAHFDGTAYFKADVATEALTDDDNYMLMFWFKGDKGENANTSLFSITDRMSVDFDSNHALLLRTYRGLSSLNTDGEAITLSENNYNDGLWHHFALNVRRGTAANVYIDGQPVKTINENQVPAFAASHVFLGARERNVGNEVKPDRMFKGDIDEFAVWKATIDGTTLSESLYFQYDSIMPSLLIYYPMEHKYKDANGVIHAEFSLESSKKSTTGELHTAEGPNVTQALNAPPLKTRPTHENLDFDFTANDNEIFIKLKTLPSRMHGNVVSFTVQGVPDVYGNLSNAITWTARANYSTLKWEPYMSDVIYMQKDYEYDSDVRVPLVNIGTENCNYTLTSLPSWVTVDKKEGTIAVGQKEEITFNITQNAPLGTNTFVIYASNNDGILEPLLFYIVVYGNEPEWDFDPSMYENSMSIIGQVYIQDKIATQGMTRIAAFIDDECRGMSNPVLMPSRDAYFTNLVVYGNPSDDTKPITFRIYDSERGVVYSDVITTINGEEKQLEFTNNLLQGNYDMPVKWNATNLIEQILNLDYSWNWISLNVQPLSGKESPNDVLGTNASFYCIKNKEGGITFCKSGGWSGTLTSMEPGVMYKLKMANAIRGLSVRGNYINTNGYPLTISNGYNWIGSLSLFNLSLNEAFAELHPVKGDWVISKQGIAYYNGFQWEGTLQSIIPGRGYVYVSVDEETKTFHYPSVETMQSNGSQLTFDDDDNVTATSDWCPFTPIDHHLFSDNMHVIATLTDGTLPVDTAWVAAYIDGECRGVTHAINGIYYITVAANAEESGKVIQFRTFYDNEVRGIVETCQFLSDNIEGDPDTPKMLTIGNSLGIDELHYTGISITPPKTQRMVYVRSELPLRSVEVYSTVGAHVMSCPVHEGKADIDLLTVVDGVYIVKAVDQAGNVSVKRIIKTNKAE